MWNFDVLSCFFNKNKWIILQCRPYPPRLIEFSSVFLNPYFLGNINALWTLPIDKIYLYKTYSCNRKVFFSCWTWLSALIDLLLQHTWDDYTYKTLVYRSYRVLRLKQDGKPSKHKKTMSQKWKKSIWGGGSRRLKSKSPQFKIYTIFPRLKYDPSNMIHKKKI